MPLSSSTVHLVSVDQDVMKDETAEEVAPTDLDDILNLADESLENLSKHDVVVPALLGSPTRIWRSPP